MTITEIQKNLFEVPQGYYLAHCISGDYALGAGIAKTFDEVYDMRFKLHKFYPIPDGERYANVGEALLVDNVFNLVTKQLCWHKPTYESVYDTLEYMRDLCENLHITKLAMPKIASGLDRLQWDQVKELIEEVFADTDIDILICSID